LATTVVVVVLLALLAAYMGGSGGAPGSSATATPGPRGNTSAVSVEWVPDGVISEGEYEVEYSLAGGNFLLYLRVENGTLYMGMAGRTEGWIAIGIEPTYMMKDADMIIAWIDINSTVHVVDAYSTGTTGPHPPDTQLGGTNDILQYGGREDNGWTTIELSRKLDTGDQYDKPLTPGSTITIIYGMSTQDSFQAYHDVTAGYANITIPG